MAELRGDLATVSKKADTAKDGPAELAPLIEAQRRHLEDTLRLHEANLVAIETSRRVHERLQSEVGRGLDALSPKQIARSAWDRAKAVWTYPFGEIEGQTIDVGRVVRGLITFIIGWIVARILATLIVHRLLKRFRLSKDASAAIKTLLFYGLLVVATLIALKVINIPLTAFTILGGALAIGVGFGSQAIFNNFLSGLIMLAERPVRIGERIVFGNYDGTVEEVGFRSTKVRTLTDHLVTIPNSNLINEPIENIGRRRTIRRIIQVTITYDTPREKIVEAVQVIRDVLDEPGIREPIHPVIGWDKFPPRVFFNDYNAESLNIQVVYWFAPPEYWDYMEHCQKVNLRIYEEFERLGVDFAFPSRTLYLAGDAKRELAVRLSSNGSQSHDAA
jgi:MscS family membrane protein